MSSREFKRGDLIAQGGPAGDAFGFVLQCGPTTYDVIWLGGSTSRYRHDWNRHVRRAAYAELDPFTREHLEREYAKALDERARGAHVCRAGGP